MVVSNAEWWDDWDVGDAALIAKNVVELMEVLAVGVCASSFLRRFLYEDFFYREIVHVSHRMWLVILQSRFGFWMSDDRDECLCFLHANSSVEFIGEKR